MGTLHSIKPLLPVRSALEFIDCQPDTEGRVVLTVVCGVEEVELSFTADEAALLCGKIADAVEIAEGMGR
jgi:hypothetical protein